MMLVSTRRNNSNLSWCGACVKLKIAADVAYLPLGKGRVAVWKFGVVDDYFEISDVSAELWLMLERPCSKSDLLKAIQNGGSVSRARASRYVDRFLKQLTKRKLIGEVGARSKISSAKTARLDAGSRVTAVSR